MKVEPDLYRRAASVFEQVVDLTPATREELLVRLVGGDRELRDAVDWLLEQDQQAADEFLKAPEPTASPDWVGRELGAYRLVRRIAEGGTSTVYYAERAQGDYSQRAAIKVFHSGATRSLRRFERERQFLASLDHHSIARLLDSGLTEDGLPFLIMEYIDGVPITEHWGSRSGPGSPSFSTSAGPSNLPIALWWRTST